ncbi:hypothetical protein Strvi_5979 [Streptomyces violaceusniger Tu 4113]|uniref:Uncharacterized protein n=1 Tax=Streptomyces violaceusniger (strain Tu 4113) TaxID=653045 RepID=G2PGA5_STRV4|nr:hypothetical protein Strvi_5979 [Streptomyces violaceusniger Tu 4113]
MTCSDDFSSGTGLLLRVSHHRRRNRPDKNLLGRYSFQLPDLPGGLRPLRSTDATDDE